MIQAAGGPSFLQELLVLFISEHSKVPRFVKHAGAFSLMKAGIGRSQIPQLSLVVINNFGVIEVTSCGLGSPYTQVALRSTSRIADW